MNYYVYIYYRDDTPIYVGLGRAARDISHLKRVKKQQPLVNPHLENTLKKMLLDGIEPRIIRHVDGLSKEDAARMEQHLIATFGRRDLGTGTLTNMTGGGDGYTDWSPAAKDVASKRRKGTTVFKNVVTGELVTARVDDRRVLEGQLVGVNAGKKIATGSMKGLVQARTSDGTCIRVHRDDPRWKSGELVGINKGKTASPEVCAKMSAALKGIPRPKPAGFSEKMKEVARRREAKKRELRNL